MNYEGVYRTTPATPGLLKISEYHGTTGPWWSWGAWRGLYTVQEGSIPSWMEVENCPG